MKIDWFPDLPPEVVEAVRPALERHRRLLPPWLQTLHVKYSPENDCTACTSASVEYRWASITFKASFLMDSPEEREDTIVHELLEVALAPVRSFTDDLIDRLLKDDDPKFHGWAEEHFMRACEGVIQDLAWGLAQPEGKPEPQWIG